MHRFRGAGNLQALLMSSQEDSFDFFYEREGNETEIGVVSASPRRSRGLAGTHEPQDIRTSCVKRPDTVAGSP